MASLRLLPVPRLVFAAPLLPGCAWEGGSPSAPRALPSRPHVSLSFRPRPGECLLKALPPAFPLGFFTLLRILSAESLGAGWPPPPSCLEVTDLTLFLPWGMSAQVKPETCFRGEGEGRENPEGWWSRSLCRQGM